jgi:hypothetical protein
MKMSHASHFLSFLIWPRAFLIGSVSLVQALAGLKEKKYIINE